MPDFPYVSIIVAAYNAENTISRCLDSLKALSYPEYDIIVVDNNSQDRTAEIIKRYQVSYLLEKKKGWPAARNTGVSYSSAEYVANIDADCFASPQWLHFLLTAFDDDNMGCVVGKTLVEEGRTLAQKYYAYADPFNIEKKIGESNFIPWGGGNNLMLRSAFIEAGGYDSNRFISGADSEFHYRLEKEFGYKTIYRPEAIIYHEARGSMREFFSVAAKYAHDGYLRSQTEEMKDAQDYYHFFLIRRLFSLAKHAIGIGYRCIKMLLGKETWFRVASIFFSIIELSGTIYGYCKGHLKIALGRVKLMN